MKRICSVFLLLLLVACARVSPPIETSGPENVRIDRKSSPEKTRSDLMDELASEYGSEYADEEDELADPVKPWNWVWFQFNDKLHFWLFKPVSRVYGWILFPRFVRIGINNLITNLASPGRIFNTLLQGRPVDAWEELERFVTNTTVGVLGLWDPATHWLKLDFHDEDFDQTLGVWGMGMGIYITWPIVGPSSVRGTLGSLGESVLNPVVTLWYVSILHRINTLSLEADDYQTLVEMALDPYTGVRNAYVQNRKEVIGK